MENGELTHLRCVSLKLKRIVVLLFVMACLIVAMWFYLNSDSASVIPSVAWNVSGKVIDQSSNTVPDVNITAVGYVRVTIVNRFGVKERAFHKATNTDKNGKFSFGCDSYAFSLLFQKAGFQDYSTNFYIGDTNGRVRIVDVQLRRSQ